MCPLKKQEDVAAFKASLLEPPTEVFDAFKCVNSEGVIQAVNEVFHDKQTGQPLAFVIPNLLNDKICDELIKSAEAHGIQPPIYPNSTLRSASRTDWYMDESFSSKVQDLFPIEFFEKLELSDEGWSFQGFNPNWRIIRYEKGQSFPPHRDQCDMKDLLKDDGSKDFLFTSHTLLINLSQKGEYEGGATRFFLDGTYSGRKVDVVLPRGWGIVFKQRFVLHCGMPVKCGTKTVAQTGLFRLLPPGEKFVPYTFKFGPGLQEALHTQDTQTINQLKSTALS